MSLKTNMGLEFHVLTASPYNVRIRYQNQETGQFDWQIQVTAADWVALIAAITAAIGTAGATYTIPNPTYPTDTPRYAGSLAPNDYMP